MPTVSYDFSNAGDFADFTVLDNGLYVFKFKKADSTAKSRSGGKKVVVDLIVTASQPHNRWAIGGLVRQHWPTEGPASGRFRDFLIALGVNLKDKGALKLEKYYEQEIGANSTKVVGKETDAEGNPVFFNELSRMQPGDQMREVLGLGAAADDEEGDEDEPEEVDDAEEADEEGEEEGEEAADDDEDGEEAAEEEEEEEGGISFEDLASMSLKELKELAVENEISVKPPKGKTLTSALLRKRLAVLFEADEEEGEEDPF